MKNQAKWTFMVYLAGDNNLSDAGETDMDEMSKAGSTAEVNIVAEFDRIGDQHHSKRFYVKPGEVQEVVDLGETDSGDPNVLLDFVSWTAKEYPADRYALVLWNHGGGWQPSSIDEVATEVKTKGFSRSEGKERSSSPLGRVFFRTTMTEIFSLESAEERAICSDDGTGHSLDTIELGKVLERMVGEDVLGQPLDLLGMDACLMSNLEVAYQARPYVKYVVASEENEPFDGWPYDTVLAKLVAEPGIATADFGAHIVDAYIASYKGSGSTVTQSALDLSQIDTLTGPLDELSQALIAHMPDAAYEILVRSEEPGCHVLLPHLVGHRSLLREVGRKDDQRRGQGSRDKGIRCACRRPRALCRRRRQERHKGGALPGGHHLLCPTAKRDLRVLQWPGLCTGS